jgi:hypothetical protein
MAPSCGVNRKHVSHCIMYNRIFSAISFNKCQSVDRFCKIIALTSNGSSAKKITLLMR